MHHRLRDGRGVTQGNKQCFSCVLAGRERAPQHTDTATGQKKAQTTYSATRHSTTGHRRAKHAPTTPQNDSRAQQHSTTRQHSTTEHDTGRQDTTANHTNRREIDHTARQGHRHRNTPPADNHGPPDPAPHQRTPEGTAQHTATHRNTRRQRQHAPHEQHNASAPAQRSTAPHRAGRTGNAQHNTPGHTQYNAQQRATARTNTLRQNTHSREHTARGNTAKHSAAKHRAPGRQAAPQGATQQAAAPQRAQQNSTAHNSTTPDGTTRRSAVQHRTQGHTAQHSTRQTAPSGGDKNCETRKGGGGAAATREQPTARRKTQKGRERGEAGGQQRKQRTAPRPTVPGAGNQRKPETTGAHNERERNKYKTEHQAAATKTARHKVGAATTREQPTARRETQTRQEGMESRAAGGQQNKQHTAPRPAAPRAGNQRKPEKTGAPPPKKKQGTGRRRRKAPDTNGEGGGAEGGNHQETANGRAEDTNKARAYGEPRSERPTTQTTHSAEAEGTRGWEPKKARDNGGAEGRKKKRGGAKQHRPAGGGGEENKAPRPKAPGARNRRTQETTGARGKQQKKKKGQRKGQPQPGGGRAKETDTAAKGKVEATRTHPGGRPARPSQDGRAHAHVHGTRACRPLTRKRRCRRPHETAQVHRPSPPSKDGRHGKPDASVTGSTHANHRSARSPRPTPEGPARENPIAWPRTGTTRSEPSVPASAGASGRHNEPGSQPASACPAQPPSKAEGASPRGGERHHGVRKTDRSTGSDRTGRGAAQHAGPRGTPERHATGHNQGTRTGAKQQQPLGAANPESAHNTQRTTAQEQVPSNTSRRPDGRVRARRVPSPYWLRTAAVRMDECALGGYSAPAGYEQSPSGWTSARPEGTQPLTAMNSRRPDGRVSAQQRRPAHATPHAQPEAQHTERAPVNKSQAAQDTVHTTQRTERAHW